MLDLIIKISILVSAIISLIVFFFGIVHYSLLAKKKIMEHKEVKKMKKDELARIEKEKEMVWQLHLEQMKKLDKIKEGSK